jgi:hypothetical protein
VIEGHSIHVQNARYIPSGFRYTDTATFFLRHIHGWRFCGFDPNQSD